MDAGHGAQGAAMTGALVASVFDVIFTSVVLTHPAFVGGLAASAVVWGGVGTRPDAARRRSMLMAATSAGTSAGTSPGQQHAVNPARWLPSRLQRGASPHPDRVATELPAIVEVMNVGLAAGLSITASLQLALSHRDANSVTGRWLAGLAASNRPLDEALDEFGRTCGPRGRAFASTVTGSLRTGIPLVHELDRLGRELRDDLRRRLERRVRRLPVLLLFPLVLCVLPALGLVAIVPVLVAAFGA